MTLSPVLFDLDGTLIDSLPDVLAAVNRLLDREGRRPLTIDEARLMVGEGAKPLIAQAFAKTGEAAAETALSGYVDRFVSNYREDPVARTIVFPGVESVLSSLAADGVPMGICTNKPHAMSELVLRKLGLDRFFSCVIGGDALSVKKPDAGHLHAVLEAMKCSPAGAIYVGDSPTDVEAARNSGLHMVLVTWGYSRVEPATLGADALIDRFDDLPAALDRVRTTIGQQV